MRLNSKELKNENDYLNQVENIIKENITILGQNINKKKINNLEFKKYIFKECQGLATSTSFERRLEYNNLVNETIEENKKIDKMSWQYTILQNSQNCPYFARVDFETRKDNTKVYIGLCSISKDLNIYVYDWRAPISSLYYNYGVGPAEYETQREKICGDIKLKRQYKINKGKLDFALNSDISIDDEILQAVLNNTNSLKLQNIVKTIQKEQNEIIRTNKKGNFIIEGIAGSGKTVIAMHRIAYLLYNEKNLTSDNVLILSPSNEFSDYISDILPQMGERNVVNTTFYDMAVKYLHDYADIETYESYLNRSYDNHINYYTFDEIDTFMKEYVNNLHFKNSIRFGKYIFNKSKLTDMFRKYNKLTVMERINNIVEYICNVANITDANIINKAYDVIQKVLSASINTKEIFNQFTSTNTKEIGYQDIEIMLYIHFYINDYPLEKNIKYVVIDEAQDYSLLQLYLLTKIFRNADFTILGDSNQCLNKYCDYKTLEKISDVFISSNYIKLEKTYRSSFKIVEYTNRILGLNNIYALRNISCDDVLEKKEDLLADLTTLKSKYQSVAIVVNDTAQKKQIYTKYKPQENNLSLKYTKGIPILTVYEAKGLEFDSVIVYNHDKKMINKLFYIACSRAKNSLIVYL